MRSIQEQRAWRKCPAPKPPSSRDLLEQKLQCHLHDTRIVETSTSHITETTLASVVDDAIRIRKLRMVEDIECFCPKLQLGALGDGGAFQQSHIIIIDARTGEVSPHGVSYLSQWFRDEEVRVEKWQPL